MTLYRVLTGNTIGVAAVVLASEGKFSRDIGGHGVEVAAIADALSMDMAKEALGILQGEQTETVTGDRGQLKRELRWIYVQCMEYLKNQPNCVHTEALWF